MQITITKENKKRKYNVIRSWNDVTLDKWAKLITSKTKTKSKEAIEPIKLLSDIPEKILKQLTLNDTAELMKYLSKLQAEENTVFNRIIEKLYKHRKSFNQLTIDTVKNFLIDSRKSKFKF